MLERWTEFRQRQRAALRASNHPHQAAPHHEQPVQEGAALPEAAAPATAETDAAPLGGLTEPAATQPAQGTAGDRAVAHGADPEEPEDLKYGRIGKPMNRQSPFYIGFLGALGALIAIGLWHSIGRLTTTLTILVIALFLTLALNHGPFGFDPGTFSGPFLTFIVFAQYLVPLTVLEFYLRAKEQGGTAARLAMAGVLFVLTLGMGAGISVVVMADWAPKVKTAFDSRISIAKTLSMTIASSSVEQAVRQYHELKVAQPAAYNLDESELDSLGYELLHGGKVKEAIRIFQLNVEAYPQASNPYDSLGEGYMNDGDKAQAIANYRKSFELNPKNRNAVTMLQKLNAP